MELKWTTYPTNRPLRASFNRTFMELKLKPYERHDKIRTVLIVPLWN